MVVVAVVATWSVVVAIARTSAVVVSAVFALVVVQATPAATSLQPAASQLRLLAANQLLASQFAHRPAVVKKTIAAVALDCSNVSEAVALARAPVVVMIARAATAALAAAVASVALVVTAAAPPQFAHRPAAAENDEDVFGHPLISTD